MFMCMCRYNNVNVFIKIDVYMCVYKEWCIYVCSRVCVDINLLMCRYKFINVCINIEIYMCVYKDCVYKDWCIYVCSCVCVDIKI